MQQRGYDMRISDWSSDVCSSDGCASDLTSAKAVGKRALVDILRRLHEHEEADQQQAEIGERGQPDRAPGAIGGMRRDHAATSLGTARSRGRSRSARPISGASIRWRSLVSMRAARRNRAATGIATRRSEEHPSELPSLMRTSYAVFFLKKK